MTMIYYLIAAVLFTAQAEGTLNCSFEDMCGFDNRNTFLGKWNAGDRIEQSISHLTPTVPNGRDQNVLYFPDQSTIPTPFNNHLYSEAWSEPLYLTERVTVEMLYFMRKTNRTVTKSRLHLYTYNSNAAYSLIDYLHNYNEWQYYRTIISRPPGLYQLDLDGYTYAKDEVVAINYITITNEDGTPVTNRTNTGPTTIHFSTNPTRSHTYPATAQSSAAPTTEQTSGTSPPTTTDANINHPSRSPHTSTQSKTVYMKFWLALTSMFQFNSTRTNN